MSAARPLDPWRWLGVPMLQALGATVLFGVPMRVWGLQLPEPVFPMAVVFAWAVIRPSILAPFAALAMGLFLDLFWGGLLGLWPLSLLLVYGLVLAARSMVAGQSRSILWVWYGVLTAVAFGAASLLVMLREKAAPGVVGLGWQFVVTLVLYPFADRLIETFEDADVRFR